MFIYIEFGVQSIAKGWRTNHSHAVARCGWDENPGGLRRAAPLVVETILMRLTSVLQEPLAQKLQGSSVRCGAPASALLGDKSLIGRKPGLVSVREPRGCRVEKLSLTGFTVALVVSQ